MGCSGGNPWSVIIKIELIVITREITAGMKDESHIGAAPRRDRDVIGERSTSNRQKSGQSSYVYYAKYILSLHYYTNIQRAAPHHHTTTPPAAAHSTTTTTSSTSTSTSRIYIICRTSGSVSSIIITILLQQQLNCCKYTINSYFGKVMSDPC